MNFLNLEESGGEFTVYCVASKVLTIIPTMETPTKDMDMMETICAMVLLSECSIKSQRNF